MQLDMNTVAVAVGLGDDEQLDLDTRSVEAACELAQTFGAKVVLLHARREPVVVSFPEIESTYPQLSEALRALEDQSLEKLRAIVEGRSLHCDVVSTASGASVAQHIVHEAERVGADLLVIASHSRHGAGWLFLGSVAERVAHLSTIPVFLLPRRSGEEGAEPRAKGREARS